MTTKDDSLNHSDIDYLENVLIEKAFAIQKLDCDNKKSGNPPKVDIFKKTLLNQYLEEALFLMQLIGVRVFAEEKSKKRKKSVRTAAQPAINLISPSIDASIAYTSDEGIANREIPPLPDSSLKIGEYVYTAMKNLESSGFVFSEEEISHMCTEEWSKEHFHTHKPFMKRYIPGQTDNKGADGFVRFKSGHYSYGTEKVLISKEWFERQRQYFIAWYESLRG